MLRLQLQQCYKPLHHLFIGVYANRAEMYYLESRLAITAKIIIPETFEHDDFRNEKMKK